MNGLIEACLDKSRTVLLLLAFLIVAGTITYLKIPKESDPDVKIPVMVVACHQEGISPSDAERLIVKPLEQKLKTIEGVKKMSATAYEGGGYVLLEFHAGFDARKAKSDVRDQTDLAKPDLPEDADAPVIEEVNLGLLPVLVIHLSGDIPDRTLYRWARDLKDALESRVPQVLKAQVVGDRKEVVEIVVDPIKILSLRLSLSEVMRWFTSNNRVITAGDIKMEAGQFKLSVPGLVSHLQDILDMPLKVHHQRVIQIKDVAEVRRTFKDPLSFARHGGKTSVAIEISKRTGENIIETIEKVKAVTAHLQKQWPPHVHVQMTQDKSHHIQDMLTDLQNNIIAALLLVMIVIIASLGWRSSLLVGIAVPGSFLAGILVLSWLGLTVNVVVLFSLILSVGMLVDGAIIVVEYADRLMLQGMHKVDAYLGAAQRMVWPVISSISTILVVFLPLLFWPGVVGQFMKFLPITLLATLGASLLMALIFVPTLGALWGKPSASHDDSEAIRMMEAGSLDDLKGMTGTYVRWLQGALLRPGIVLLGALGVLVGVILLYKTSGRGVEFFPDVEPDTILVKIHARGHLSLEDKDILVREVEKKVLAFKEFKSVYALSGAKSSQDREDLIGKIMLECVDWKERRPAQTIMRDLEEVVHKIPGIQVDVQKESSGPSSAKPIEICVQASDEERLRTVFAEVLKIFQTVKGLTNTEDSLSSPGFEWRAHIDRAEAARWGADIQMVGSALKMLTDGLRVGGYRAPDYPDELDVVLRFPVSKRHMQELEDLRIMTPQGSVPIQKFVRFQVEPQTGLIHRMDGQRVFWIKTDVAPGVLVDAKVQELRHVLKPFLDLSDVQVTFKGEEEDQKESGQFLMQAFIVALFLIAVILTTQFNSLFETGLVLSAVIMSTIGVFFGLWLRGMAFGIVMGGIGVIALAGIIVSNNIILIDTFKILRERMPVYEAILRTGAQRLRPVILTKLTTVLGLLPIMFRLNIDFMQAEITYGAPSTQWWTQLATCIVCGVLFASVLTLFVTPCALMLRYHRKS